MVPKAVAEKLPGLEQPMGLLVPKALPDLPQVPLELLPGVITQMGLSYMGEQQVPAQDYQAAKAW